MKWFPNRSKTAGQPPNRPADVLPSTPAPSDVDAYTEWVNTGAALSEVLDRQDEAVAANPDTVHLRRQRAYDASAAEIEAAHRRRMDGLREDDDQRRHDLAARRRHRRLETAAVDGEIDYRINERDEARARRRQIMTARAAHDPAIAAAEMTRDGAQYVRTYTRISLAGAALAAVGLGAAAMTAGLALPLAIVSGLLGEVVLTLLITKIIGGRAALHARQRLARDHGGAVIAVATPSWATQLPWYGVGGLLVASISINVHGALTGEGGAQILGALGALGAAIAALATGLAWGYSVETSATVGTLLSDHGIQQGLAELDAVAAGTRLRDLYTATDDDTATTEPIAVDSTTPPPTRADILAALAADPSLIDAAITGAVDTAIEHMTAPVAEIDQVDAHDVEDDTDDGESMESGAVAIADRPNNALAEGARRATRSADANRAAVTAAYDELLSETGEAPTAAEIARRVGLSDRTVRRHLQNGQ